MLDLAPNYILPGAVVCPDISGNTVARDCCPAVLIAPMMDTGTAEPYKPYPVPSTRVAAELFGSASPAFHAAEHYLQANPFGELQVMGFNPSSFPGAASASASVELSGTATDASIVSFFVNCQFVSVGAISGDTGEDIAALIADEINASSSLPVTATATPTGLTIDAKFAGSAGNQIVLSASGLPEGLTATLPDMSGGLGVADYATALSSLGDCCCYDFVGIIDNDDNSMDILTNWFEGRWGCDCFVGGRFYNTFRGGFTEMTTYLDRRNDRFGSTMMICPGECAADYEKLGSFIGAAHLRRCNGPSRTWNKAELTGIPNADTGDIACGTSCLSDQERNIIANMGGTLSINGPGAFQVIEIATGLGSVDDDGNIDQFLRFPQAAYQTMDVARKLSAFVDDAYDDVLVVSEETVIRPGSNAVTPNMIKAELKAFFRTLEGTIIENVDNLDDFINVSINENNPSRVDASIFFDLSSALRTFAIQLSPRVTLGV